MNAEINRTELRERILGCLLGWSAIEERWLQPLELLGETICKMGDWAWQRACWEMDHCVGLDRT
ncbi:MAG: hypothetical protein IJD21_09815 [Oscillospiraceae bacterium]|nr:hypothetical protein [Oscillospiraceae bacterium]